MEAVVWKIIAASTGEIHWNRPHIEFLDPETQQVTFGGGMK